MTSFANATLPLNKWKVGSKVVNSSVFELRAGQLAVYDGDVNKGKHQQSFEESFCSSHTTFCRLQPCDVQFSYTLFYFNFLLFDWCSCLRM